MKLDNAIKALLLALGKVGLDVRLPGLNLNGYALAERELVDRECPHGFNALIVKGPLFEEDRVMRDIKVSVGEAGPLCASLEITGVAHGHPAVKQTITLCAGVKEIHLATRLLKDATALPDVRLAFPFATSRPEFRYEGALAAMTPVDDYWPGSYWNRITVQNWVKVVDDDFSIVWSSPDAPMVSLAGLWPDYVSPAHRCQMDERLQRSPVDPSRLTENGWIYSNIAFNNTGTNFSCVQVGDICLLYIITTCEGRLSDGQTALWAQEAVSPTPTIFTERRADKLQPNAGTLPASLSFAELDNEDVVLLACKQAEDGGGIILRLWNLAHDSVNVTVSLPWLSIKQAALTNLIEEDQDAALPSDAHTLTVGIDGRAVATVRVVS